MSIEEKLEQSKFYLKQVIYYNPDPHYVNHFLTGFIRSIIDIYDGIFQEVNRDFGLFIPDKCTLEKLENRSKEKNDKLALEFLSWYNENYKMEHKTPYPNYIENLISFYKKTKHLPKIKIKIIANQRYNNDPNQEISVGLSKGKIRSKKELELEIKRQIPVFLELINLKRKKSEQPKVSANQVMASAFIGIGKSIDFEIIDVCQAYLSVLNRFVDSSRNKIRQLTQF